MPLAKRKMCLHCCSFDQLKDITCASNIPKTTANCNEDPKNPRWFTGVNSFINMGEMNKDRPDPIPLRNRPILICNVEFDKAISNEPIK